MTYKYKESIKNAVNEMYSASFVDEENRKNELDKVYAQATKADEYEAKVKAFDESLKGFKKLERLHDEVRKGSKRHRERSDVYKETLTHVIREMESNLEGEE